MFLNLFDKQILLKWSHIYILCWHFFNYAVILSLVRPQSSGQTRGSWGGIQGLLWGFIFEKVWDCQARGQPSQGHPGQSLKLWNSQYSTGKDANLCPICRYFFHIQVGWCWLCYHFRWLVFVSIYVTQFKHQPRFSGSLTLTKWLERICVKFAFNAMSIRKYISKCVHQQMDEWIN